MLAGLEAGGLESDVGGAVLPSAAPERNPASSSFWGLRESSLGLQLRPPIAASVATWPSLCVYLPPRRPVPMRTQSLGIGSNSVWLHLNLVTSAKTSFPNAVVFIGTRCADFTVSFQRTQFDLLHASGPGAGMSLGSKCHSFPFPPRSSSKAAEKVVASGKAWPWTQMAGP